MTQDEFSLCDCCGLTVDLKQVKICPRCQYPVDPEKEQRFLEESLRDLRRVARYGGALVTVAALLQRYEGRLQFLLGRNREQAAPLQVAEPSVPRLVLMPEFARTSVPAVEEPVRSFPRPIVSPGIAVEPAASMRGFTFSSDAVINILAALGGFFVLAGALGVVLTISNLWLSFLVILLVHSVFGIAGLITRRASRLQAVSTLYTILFALLVPLVAFSAYRLVTNGLVELSAPLLLTLAALYAAATYGLLAVTQRFVPFAYLAAMALLVVDLALSQTLKIDLWWWPCTAMLLALLLLPTVPRLRGTPRLFAEARAILRGPLQGLMRIILGLSIFAGLLLLFLDWVSANLDVSDQLSIHLAMTCLSALLLLWTALWIWWTGRTSRTPWLAYQFLLTLLLLGHTLQFDLTGFVLLLTGVALSYHLLVRVAGKRLATYGLPDGLALDQLVIGLSLLVLLLLAFPLPAQLYYRAYAGAAPENFLLSFIGNTHALNFVPGVGLPDLLALGCCLLVTLDMVLLRAGWGKTPVHRGWNWLLVLSGLIFSAGYGLEVLLWNVSPLPAFLALSLGWLISAMLLRRFASMDRAYPFELLFFSMVSFTLILSLGSAPEVTCALLLGFAILLYGALLFQHRAGPSLFSLFLALLALPGLWQTHPIVIIGLGIFFPILCALLLQIGWLGRDIAVRANPFVWSLLGTALVYGLVFAFHESHTGSGVFALWSGLPVPAAYELALLGAGWYLASLLGRVKVWLVPACLAWLLTVFFLAANFWLLVALIVGLAIVGALIDRRTLFDWALPFYLTALFGALVVGHVSLTAQHITDVSWALLGFAFLAYGISVFTDHQPLLWLIPFFVSWSVFIAAFMLNDAYLPPLIVIVAVGCGLLYKKNAFPFYTTALVAVLLSGSSGTFGDINWPFYGAIPTLLLFYALIACVVGQIVQRPSWNLLVAGLAIWGIALSQQLTPIYTLIAGCLLALLGLFSGICYQSALKAGDSGKMSNWRASAWSWYTAFFVAIGLFATWPSGNGQPLPGLAVPGLVIFTGLAVAILLFERRPVLLPVPAALLAWTIHLWPPTSAGAASLLAYTLLCVLFFATQFIWRLLPVPSSQSYDTAWHNGLAIGGLMLVILDALSQGAFSASAGSLAQASVLATATLGGMLLLYGWVYPANVVSTFLRQSRLEEQRAGVLKQALEVRHWSYYTAGLVFSIAVSWELLACQQTRFDVLTLVPASYLIIVAPFLLRDQALEARHRIGQTSALLGAALLLLPALWFSLNGADLLPTFILLMEALLLLATGLIVRMRIFILSSASLIVIGTLRILFLAMPPSVPILLMVFGGLLVLLSTMLILSRHRLQAAWSSWQ
jgi:hypothetical protein